MAYVLKVKFFNTISSTTTSSKSFVPTSPPLTKEEWQARYRTLPEWLKTTVEPETTVFDYTTGLKKPRKLILHPQDLRAPYSWAELVALDYHSEKMKDNDRYGRFSEDNDFAHLGQEQCPKCKLFGVPSVDTHNQPIQTHRYPPMITTSIEKVTNFLLDRRNGFEDESNPIQLPIICQTCCQKGNSSTCCIKCQIDMNKELFNNGEILFQEIDGCWMTWNPIDGYKETPHYEDLNRRQLLELPAQPKHPRSLDDLLHSDRTEQILSMLVDQMTMNTK